MGEIGSGSRCSIGGGRMGAGKLTVRKVLFAITSGGVAAIPLVGGVLWKLMDLTDRSTADELANLRTARSAPA